MNIFKINKIKIFSIIALFAIFSCDDILDQEPLGTVKGPEEIGAGGFQSSMFGIYSQTRTTGVGQWQRYWFGSIRSDDAAKGSTDGDSAANGSAFNDFDYVANNGLSTSWWNDHYKIIFNCNEIINNVQSLIEAGEAQPNDLIIESEARTMRAWMYFELRRDYGEIPIITVTVDVPSDGFAPKSSIEDIDNFIIDDLIYAIQYLPLSWPSYPGRITLGFANGLLGKLYLYKQDWVNAYDYLFDVIESEEYHLDTDLEKLFDVSGDNGPESVFEIQQLNTPAQSYADNYYISQGVRGAGVWNLGWGFNVPTQELVDAFEADDTRKAVTILYTGESDNYENGSTLPTGLVQPYWNRKAYTKPSTRNEQGTNFNRWENIKIMRYADVLLMAAEAANELNMPIATDYIDEVRNRAGLDDTEASGQADIRDAIKHERRVELAMEEHRFYDLVRWGDAEAVLGPLGYQSRNALYPIPTEAIDNSGGIIEQNPDY